jgi:hypothetical protein
LFRESRIFYLTPEELLLLREKAIENDKLLLEGVREERKNGQPWYKGSISRALVEKSLCEVGSYWIANQLTG